MKKTIIVALVVLISISMAGCTNPPSPPGSEIPMVIIDYVSSFNYDNVDENHTIIYVHGLDDVKYENITIKINNKTVAKRNHTYSLEHNTNLKKFNLTVDVYHNGHDERYFNFNATFDIVNKKKIMYKITYSDLEKKEVEKDDLPYSEKLDQIEVDKNA